MIMSVFIASILLSSCSSSIKSESNPEKSAPVKKGVDFIPASDEDIFLYRQIGISYLCMARQIEVEFPKAITLAAKNYSLLISNRHGGLIKELGDTKLDRKQLFAGAEFQIVSTAMSYCPDSIPKDVSKKVNKLLKENIKNKK